eukprot:TRINITY_DN3762_c1_g1_i2.p1 TRINITY_DN3762_c1_g1~~TRINITY_DN3762_c1_g1_i2.p1  ORF type:complete len:213 (-),score=2.77 TRINITY_DN3762_c1_g1_i2:364-1002(-)
MLLYPSFFVFFADQFVTYRSGLKFYWSILFSQCFLQTLNVVLSGTYIQEIFGTCNKEKFVVAEILLYPYLLLSIFVQQVFFVAVIANLKEFLHIFYQQLGQGYFQVVDLFNPINSDGLKKIFHGSRYKEETVFCCEEETVFCCEGLIIVRYHVNLICISRYQTLAAEDNFVCLQYFVVWMRVILHYRNYLGFQPFFLIFVLVFVHAIFFGVI